MFVTFLLDQVLSLTINFLLIYNLLNVVFNLLGFRIDSRWISLDESFRICVFKEHDVEY